MTQSDLTLGLRFSFFCSFCPLFHAAAEIISDIIFSNLKASVKSLTDVTVFTKFIYNFLNLIKSFALIFLAYAYRSSSSYSTF
ncbi:hypothetical protein B5F87_11315 [Eubacterium sp. An3]|nr:hypothetical protein B5F87_11315 [Eubacterium sp. An3]